VIDDLAAGRAIETPQDDGMATIAPKLSRDSSKIDWIRPATEVANQIRGMYPWPGCRVRILDATGTERTRVTLVRARAVAESLEPGVIGSDGFVGAGSASVQIVELQPEGKRPMSLDAYRNGHLWDAGMRLESLV
jgi:methionyl-tRNA formyltransferase